MDVGVNLADMDQTRDSNSVLVSTRDCSPLQLSYELNPTVLSSTNILGQDLCENEVISMSLNFLQIPEPSVSDVQEVVLQSVQDDSPNRTFTINSLPLSTSSASSSAGYPSHLIINTEEGLKNVIVSTTNDSDREEKVVVSQITAESASGDALVRLHDKSDILTQQQGPGVAIGEAANIVLGGEYLDNKEALTSWLSSVENPQVVITSCDSNDLDETAVTTINRDAIIITNTESNISEDNMQFLLCDTDAPIGKGPWTCNECKDEFTKWSLYRLHQKKHLLDKPFQCDHCDASFNLEKNLHLHSAVHNPDRLVCLACDKEFRRLASFKSHIAIHQDDENVHCDICQEEFISIRQLEPHKRTHDNVKFKEKKPSVDTASPHQCHHCGIKLANLELLKYHLNLHKKTKLLTSSRLRRRKSDTAKYEKKCVECGKFFMKPSQLKRHMRIHTGERPYRCPYPGCDRAFNQKSTMVIHKNIHTGEKSFKCEFCNKTFVQKSNLRCHINRVHPINKGDEQLFECQDCTCVFKRPGSLNAHISRVHTAEVSLSSETQDPVVTPEVQNVIKILQDKYNTPKAGDFKIKEECLESREVPPCRQVPQVRLVSNETNLNEAEGDILQLALKNSGLAQPKLLSADKSRVKTETWINNNNNNNEVDKKQKQQKLQVIALIDRMVEGRLKRYPVLVKMQGDIKLYMCAYTNCLKEFKKPSDLVRHMRIHTNERPYKCSVCCRAFAVNSTLKCHMKTHAPNKEYECSSCDKKFSTSTSLRIHNRTHTGDKPFSCPKCPKVFRTVSHRKTHLLTHSHMPNKQPLKEKSRPLPDIPLQEPILITERGPIKQISRHSQIYSSESGETPPDRPHKCHYCSASFKKSSHLKQHERIHTGERPYRCEFCLKDFSSPSVRKSHYRTHSGVKTHTCKLCKGVFASSGSLTRHMTTHSTDRPYMCPYCEKTFKTNTNCKKHMKIHKMEVAMDAVRSAGSNLQGDTQQALLTANLYGEGSHENVPGVTTVDMSSEMQQKLNVVLRNSHGSEEHLANNVVKLETAFTDTDITLTDIQGNVIYTPHSNSTILLPVTSKNTTSLNPQVEFAPSSTSTTTNSVRTPQNVTSEMTDGSIVLMSQQPVLEEPQRPPDMTVLGTRSLSANDDEIKVSCGGQYKDALAAAGIDSKANIKLISISDSHSNYNNPSIINSISTPSNVPSVTSGQSRSSCGQKQTSNLDKEFQVSSDSGRMTDQLIIPIVQIFNEDLNIISDNDDHKQVLRIPAHTLLSRTNDNIISLSEENDKKSNNEDRLSDIKHNKTKPTESHITNNNGNNNNNNSTKMEETVQLFVKGKFNNILLNKTDLDKSNIKPTIEEEEEVAISPVKDQQIKYTSFNYCTSNNNNNNNNNDSNSQKSKKHVQVLYQSQKEVSKHANQCKDCDKSFKKQSDLIRHIRTHTGEKPYICVTCGKRFAVKSTLNVHMKTHTGKREYKCPLCHTMYSSKGSLNIHMRIHTGDKPLKCPYCPKHFRTSGHRKVHVLKHDRELTKAVDEAPPNVKLEATGSGEANLDTLISNDNESVMLQLPIHLNGIDATTLLNLQNVSLDENAISQLQVIGTTSAEDEGVQNSDDTLSVNPNIVMAQPRTIGSVEAGTSESNFEFYLANPGKLLSNQSLASLHPGIDKDNTLSNGITFLDQAAILSDVVITDINGEQPSVSKTHFRPKNYTLAEWPDQFNSANICVKLQDDQTTGDSTTIVEQDFQQDMDVEYILGN